MCWEQRTKPFLVLGILHRDEIYADMLLTAIQLERPGWNVTTLFLHDLPWDVSRSMAATTALESGAEWCFFWDSDIMIPSYTLTRLVSRGFPIIGGLYYRRHPDVFPEVFRQADGGILQPVPRKNLEELFQQGSQVVPVDGIGAGCLLIHRRVFENLKEKVPYRKYNVGGPPAREVRYHEFFKWSIGDEEAHKNGEGYSEDLTFCMRAKKAGYPIYVDLSVNCTHITKMGIKNGTVDWTPLDSGKI